MARSDARAGTGRRRSAAARTARSSPDPRRCARGRRPRRRARPGASIELLDHCRDARVHGAPEDQELAVDEVLGDLGDRGLYGVEVGVEVLVDRRPDDDDDDLGLPDDGGIRRGAQSSGGERPLQDRRGAGLVERQRPGVDQRRRRPRLTSNSVTSRPRSASTSANGRPTCPHPPTTATSCRNPPSFTAGASNGRQTAQVMRARVGGTPTLAPLDRPCRSIHAVDPADPSSGIDYQRLYTYRFRGIDQASRQAVWDAIAPKLAAWLGNPSRVLDPAAGRGEFVNAVDAEERWVVDSIEYDETVRDPDVKVLIGDARFVELPQGHFDGVFVSNLLEHFATQDDVARFLARMRRLHVRRRPDRGARTRTSAIAPRPTSTAPTTRSR